MNAISLNTQRTTVADRRRHVLELVVVALAIGSRAYGLTINPTFDSSITSDPQAATIEATISSAIAVYQARFSDPVTISIVFKEQTTGLGRNTTFYETFPYSSYLGALIAHATTTDDIAALAHLSAGNPVNGNPSVNVTLPLARALGLTSDSGSPDGTILLNTSICNLSAGQYDPTKYSLLAVVCHEIDEVLGFGSALNGLTNGAPTPTGPISPEDLFRYAANGTRSFTTALNAASYFSLDGITDLAQFNQYQGGDFADWYSYYGGQIPQVQDAFNTPGAAAVLGVELRVLDVIGYTPSLSAPIVWVDFNYQGQFPNGSFAAPFPTLALGVSAASPAAIVVIRSGGSSRETGPFSKPVTILAFAGSATIGQ